MAASISEISTMAFDHPLLAMALLSLAYLGLVRKLRFRNIRRLESRFPALLKDPRSMDYKTAHEILKVVMLKEFPFMYAFSTQWALIKSYGIASGTKLLVQTRRLTNEKTVGKRSEDTGVLLGELLLQGLDSQRGLLALSKMNWLHAQYGARISNDDLIHTLALFILEPIRWTAMYEWRPMTEMEAVAVFTYWKEIGNRMGMQGIPATLGDLKIWTAEYEKTAMVYADSNRKCYDATLGLFLRNSPPRFKGFATQVSSCFLEPYVRRTMAVSDPPWWVESLMASFWAMRAFLIRHTYLPRFRKIETDYVGSSGRIFRKQYQFEPWYVEESFWSSLRRRLGLAGPHPGSEFMSQGFLPEELGPREYEKASRQAVHDQAREMRSYAEKGGAEVLGCPFMMARSLQ